MLRALSWLAVCAALSFASPAAARSGGITGQSGLGGGTYCSSCHTIGATPIPTVSFSGPTELERGETGDFLFTVTRGTAAHSHAGFNVAATGGTLAANHVATRLSGSELTHDSPHAYDGESVSFAFRWTAPETAGTYTLGGAGNSVDRNFSTSGDASATATWTVEVSCEEEIWYEDADGDGFGNPDVWVLACDQPEGYVDNDFDCDDSDATVYPGAPEVCDGKDNNCSGLVDDHDPALDLDSATLWCKDADGDGYGDPDDCVLACEAPGEDWVDNDLDCDDTDPSIHPGAPEICGDGIDQDCSGEDLPCECDGGMPPRIWYRDADGDGYGDPLVTAEACEQPEGYVDNDLDCDDSDATVYPGAPEICDGKDNNCNGLIDDADPALLGPVWYRDADEDGFGDPEDSLIACTQPAGYVDNDLDCDDDDPDVHPDAVEVCDGIDNNCDGFVDSDEDGLVVCECINGATRPCYTGPAGTEGVGICEGGEQTCVDGTWGACAGEVVPLSEDDCDTPFDETCSGVVNEGCEPEPEPEPEPDPEPEPEPEPDPFEPEPQPEPEPGIDEPGGCDCASGTGTPGGLALLLLALVHAVGRHRRRRM